MPKPSFIEKYNLSSRHMRPGPRATKLSAQYQRTQPRAPKPAANDRQNIDLTQRGNQSLADKQLFSAFKDSNNIGNGYAPKSQNYKELNPKGTQSWNDLQNIDLTQKGQQSWTDKQLFSAFKDSNNIGNGYLF